ncbi:MAG: glycoside hydrolase family 16 protein, partial [Actinomycetes bacterium]
FNTRVDPTAWHVYETAWSPGKVEFFVDGVSIGSSTTNVPTTAMHWVLQMETQISSTAPPTTAQGHVQIDWVKVYVPA